MEQKRIIVLVEAPQLMVVVVEVLNLAETRLMGPVLLTVSLLLIIQPVLLVIGLKVAEAAMAAVAVSVGEGGDSLTAGELEITEHKLILRVVVLSAGMDI